MASPKYQLFSHQGSVLVVKALAGIAGGVNGVNGSLAHDKLNKVFVYTVDLALGFQLTHDRPWEIMEVQNIGLDALSLNVLPYGSSLITDLQQILSVPGQSRDSKTRQFGANEVVSFKTSPGTNPTEFRIMVRETTSYILGDS